MIKCLEEGLQVMADQLSAVSNNGKNQKSISDEQCRVLYRAFSMALADLKLVANASNQQVLKVLQDSLDWAISK